MNIAPKTKLLAKSIRKDLLDFWNTQLNFNTEPNAIHVAYPLLMPDGWQISFSLHVITGPSVYFKLTDGGRTFKYLTDNHVGGVKVNSLLKDKFQFFNMKRYGDELYMDYLERPTAMQLELFAEGLQSIAYLVYRSEKLHEKAFIAREMFERIVKVNDLKFRKEHCVAGKILGKIDVDYVVDRKQPVVCKIAEKFTDINSYMQIWAYRFSDIKHENDKLRTLMVYNPDMGRWDEKSIKIGKSSCDLFIPYSDTDRIQEFLKKIA